MRNRKTSWNSYRTRSNNDFTSKFRTHALPRPIWDCLKAPKLLLGSVGNYSMTKIAYRFSKHNASITVNLPSDPLLLSSHRCLLSVASARYNLKPSDRHSYTYQIGVGDCRVERHVSNGLVLQEDRVFVDGRETSGGEEERTENALDTEYVLGFHEFL